jgi:uncharacterized protein YecT (DUF1311 family)
MIGGVATALALGVVFGFWARPELIGSKPSNAPAPPSATPAAAAPPGAADRPPAQVPIAVNPPAPQPAPRAAGRLETLPPEMAAAARAHIRSDADDDAAAHPLRAGGASQSAPAPAAAPQVAAQGPPEAAAPPRLRASFDCASAQPGAEQIVCSDPELAAADRQLARAYRRALRSGVDPVDLRREQQDWVAIREDAASRSRRALAQVYDQRIRDLEQIAADSPGGDPGPE